MKIKLVSDLHLEFSHLMLPNNGADVLVLAGDICIAQDLHDFESSDSCIDLGSRQVKAYDYRRFLDQISRDYKHIIYVAGNHEFYHGKFYKSLQYLREECAKYSNIYFLEDDVKIIDGVVFVGATLWSNMNKYDPLTMYHCKDALNDYRCIRNDKRSYAKLSTLDTTNRFGKSKAFIRQMLNKYDDSKVVVVTHHAPSLSSISDYYKYDYLMNGAYASDLSEDIMDFSNLVYWVHGHIHDPVNYFIGNCNIVSNPRGYVQPGFQEHWKFNPELLLDI